MPNPLRMSKKSCIFAADFEIEQKWSILNEWQIGCYKKG